jgi:hypothetical protein
MFFNQILKARRFVSGFMYKTNITFNTNKLRLLLLIIIKINNTNKTFLITFIYYITKSAKTFKFVSKQLINLAFYNYLKATVICKDFSKDLSTVVKLKVF